MPDPEGVVPDRKEVWPTLASQDGESEAGGPGSEAKTESFHPLLPLPLHLKAQSKGAVRKAYSRTVSAGLPR